MLEKLKLILGVQDAEQDGVLSFALETVQDEVKNYCHIDEIPTALENIVVRMAADLCRSEGYGQAEKPQTVQSVSRRGCYCQLRQRAGHRRDNRRKIHSGRLLGAAECVSPVKVVTVMFGNHTPRERPWNRLTRIQPPLPAQDIKKELTGSTGPKTALFIRASSVPCQRSATPAHRRTRSRISAGI